MGGEKGRFPLGDSFEQGSPPHGRGKVPAFVFGPDLRGITPAWAGKRTLRFLPPHPAEDHPRMGGEKTKKIP